MSGYMSHMYIGNHICYKLLQFIHIFSIIKCFDAVKALQYKTIYMKFDLQTNNKSYVHTYMTQHSTRYSIIIILEYRMNCLKLIQIK